ncbi:hypothetical protein OC861_000321 [Tilletia horrida]|nr:hypothetical protein OC861_000321 [Tilletia horrida]
MPDQSHTSLSGSQSLHPPLSSTSRSLNQPIGPYKPARPKFIPIYVRVVPNDQWLRIHIPMNATMGSVKDAILTRARFPRTRAAVLDHLPKAIITFAPNKDPRSMLPQNALPSTSSAYPLIKAEEQSDAAASGSKTLKPSPALVGDRLFSNNAADTSAIEFAPSSVASSNAISVASNPSASTSALTPGSPNTTHVGPTRSISRLSGRRLPSLSALPLVGSSSTSAGSTGNKLSSPASSSKLNASSSSIGGSTPSASATVIPFAPIGPAPASPHEIASEVDTGATGPDALPSDTALSKAGWTAASGVGAPLSAQNRNQSNSIYPTPAASRSATLLGRRTSQGSSAVLGFSSAVTPPAIIKTNNDTPLSPTLSPDSNSSPRPRSRTITAGDAAARAFGALFSRARGKSRTKEKDRDKDKDKEKEKETEKVKSKGRSDRRSTMRAIVAGQIRSDSGIRSESSRNAFLQSVDRTPESPLPPQKHLMALPANIPYSRRSTSSPYPPRAPSTGAAAAAHTASPQEPATGNGRNSASNSVGSTGEHSIATSASVQAGGGSASGWSGAFGTPSSPEGTSNSAGTGFGIGTGTSGIGSSGTRKRRASAATTTSVSAGGGHVSGTGSGAGGGPGVLGAAFDSRRGSTQSSIGSIQPPQGSAMLSADDSMEAGASVFTNIQTNPPGTALSLSSTVSSTLATDEHDGETPFLGIRSPSTASPRRRRASAGAGDGQHAIAHSFRANPLTSSLLQESPSDSLNVDQEAAGRPSTAADTSIRSINSPPDFTTASTKAADSTFSVNVVESSGRLQRETGAGVFGSLTGSRLGGIATDKISNFDSTLSHPLAKAFSLYSYANGGCLFEDWKTVAACNIRPWELLEVQWANEGVGIGLEDPAARIFSFPSLNSDLSASALATSDSYGSGLDRPFDADASMASTTITRNTMDQSGTLRSDDDELAPLRHTELRATHSLRSVPNSPGRRPVTAPQGTATAGSGRFVTSDSIGLSPDDDGERNSNDSTPEALNFSSGVTEATKPFGETLHSGAVTPPVIFDGPPLGIGSSRVFLPRDTWVPGSGQGLSHSPAIGHIRSMLFDANYAQPFFESWVYVFKPSAKALNKSQRAAGLGVWKRRWLVVCGRRMGLLRKKEGRSQILSRWLAASGVSSNTLMTGGDEGVGLGVGFMASAGIDTEQGLTADHEHGGASSHTGGKSHEHGSSTVPEASALAQVPTYFLDALKLVHTDTCATPLGLNSNTVRVEENLPNDRISLAFHPGSVRDTKNFATPVDPSIFSNEPASALRTLTQSSSFTSNIGSALSGGSGSFNSETGVMVLHLRCVTAHDHNTLVDVLKRAMATRPGANLGGGLFSPASSALGSNTAAGLGFAYGATSLGVSTWRRSAVMRASIAGRGGTVQPGKAGRRSGRNSFSRMRSRPSGMPMELDDADLWSTGSEEEGPSGAGQRLKQVSVQAQVLAAQSQHATQSGHSALFQPVQTGLNASFRSAVSGSAQKFLRKRPSTSGSFVGLTSDGLVSGSGPIAIGGSAARWQTGSTTASPRAATYGVQPTLPESPSSPGFSTSRTLA